MKLSIRGFTVLELLVVIAIIGILTSISIYLFKDGRDRANVAAGQQFASSMHSLYGSGMVGEWRLNEGSGTIANDSSGNGLTGTLNNATWISPSQDGSNAVSFTGTIGSNISVPFSLPSSSMLAVERFAISFWMRPSVTIDASSGQKDLVTKLNSYYVLINHHTFDGKLSLMINADQSGTSADVLVRSNTSVWKKDKWYHIGVVYDAGSVKLYVNGVQDAVGLVTNTVPDDDPSTFSIGSDVWGAFPGTIDQVRVYDLDIVDQ